MAVDTASTQEHAADQDHGREQAPAPPRPGVRRLREQLLSHLPGVLLAALLLCALSPCPGQDRANPPRIPRPAAGTAQPPTRHPLEQADLEAFFDGIVPLQLERGDIAGASVLVMRDGAVLLEKGYGSRDLRSGAPVDPRTTIFRLASISKLFTAVAVMQLVEEGRLSLDADVNQYLDLRIRPAFGRPVTLRNLLTHTAGFEETFNQLILTDPRQAVTLAAYLARNQPMRIYPPGEVPAYSNYGAGLAAYIVERVSGEPFAEYVRRHIFAPLGMTRSSFEQPLPDDLRPLASEGYRSSTVRPPVGFEIVNPVGAGGLSSTASDMGRFGQALLNHGQLEDRSILKPATMALMWMPQLRVSEQLPAMCMGFYQRWRNNLRWVGHEGDLIAFHSLFFIEPEQRLVLFVSYNSAGGGEQARPEILNLFSDRYFPSAARPESLPTPLSDLGAIAGTYRSTRRAETTKLKLISLFTERRAAAGAGGSLIIEGIRDLRGHTIRWRNIGPDLWQNERDQQRLVVIRDGRGRVVRLAFDFPGSQMERVPWYESRWFVLGGAGSSLLVLLAVVMATLLRAGRRIFLPHRGPLLPQAGTRWLTWGPRLAAFAWVLLLGAIAVYFAAAGPEILPPTPRWYPWLVWINRATATALVLSAFAVMPAIREAFSRDLRRITKVKFALVALACLLLGLLAIQWHLIGPSDRI